MTDKSAYPPYLSAIDTKRNRIFVLAPPNLCAVRIDGIWQYCMPLPDEEVAQYELVTDVALSLKYVQQARTALEKKLSN